MKVKLLFPILIFGMLSGIALFARSEEEHGEAHHFHPNHVALFLGGTTHLEKGTGTYFSLGTDYEYRVSSLVGIGVIGELIFAEETEYLLALPLFLHMTDSLWFRLAPGFEVAHHSENHSEGHGEEAHESNDNDHAGSEVLFFIRMGAGYSFHAGGFSIAPTIDLDIFRSRIALVWGISIGKGF